MRGLLVAVLVVVSAVPALADPARPRAWRATPVVWRAKAKPVVQQPVERAKPPERQTPKQIYRAAQTHRVKGERGKAIELYEKYLEVSPNGPAANACKSELEKLRDVPE